MRRLVVLLSSMAATVAACGSPSGSPAPGVEEGAARPADRSPPPVGPRPEGRFEGAGYSLLDEYAGRPPLDPAEPARWQLPYQSKRMVAMLLAAAAEGRLDDLRLLLSPAARWGLPDRREVGARPVFAGDGGRAFFEAFRRAAARFRGRDRAVPGSPRSATFVCPPMLPGPEDAVRSGAEPYWCYFVSDDRLDILVFRLIVEQGRPFITYVGLFPERPTGAIAVGRTDPPPPLAPPAIRGPKPAPPATPRAPGRPSDDGTGRQPPG